MSNSYDTPGFYEAEQNWLYGGGIQMENDYERINSLNEEISRINGYIYSLEDELEEKELFGSAKDEIEEKIYNLETEKYELEIILRDLIEK